MNRSGSPRWTVALAAIVVAVAGTVRAEAGGEPQPSDRPAPLDWSEWQSLPVFHEGRLKPLDTVARSLVEDICGSAEPTLSLRGGPAADDLSDAELAARRELFPGGQPRTFTAAELVFSWLVEPEKWEHVPVFSARQGQLRKELLGVPVTDSLARRLGRVSQHQIEQARWFRDRVDELRQKQLESHRRGEMFKPVGVDAKLQELYSAYLSFRSLTFDNAAFQNGTSAIARATVAVTGDDRFRQTADEQTKDAANSLLGAIMTAGSWAHDYPYMGVAATQDQKPVLATAEELVDDIEAKAKTLVARLAQPKYRGSGWHGQSQAIFARIDELRSVLEDDEILNEHRCPIRLVPALNPLPKDPTTELHLVDPWLSVHAVIAGSMDSISRHVPPGPLRERAAGLEDDFQQVRNAFKRARAAYLDREATDRAQRFAEAMHQFADRLRILGEKIDPLREKIFERKHKVLPESPPPEGASEREKLEIEMDEELLARTVYPPRGFGDLEVVYNTLDPFFWAWVVGLLAAGFFIVSLLGAFRGPMLASGIVLLLLAEAVTTGGLVCRGLISGWVPLASMFETIVFAGLIIGLVGLWYGLFPIVAPGLKRAWRLTGIPYSWETRPAGRRAVAADAAVTSPVNLVLGGLRGLLSVGLFLYLFFPQLCARVLPSVFGSGGEPALHILPRPDKGADLPTVNNVLVWLVVMAMVLPAVWYGPRMILSALAGLVTVPQALHGRRASRAVRRAMSRTPFVLVATLVGAAATCLAYYAPMFDSDIQAISAVLRSNFWLFIHVTPIVAGFGAGVLAWGLGNLSLAYYVFGRYRGPAGLPPQVTGRIHRPASRPGIRPRLRYLRAPKGCRALSRQTYKAIQLAVLLITAGTILGAVWADVSWGRAWGWDVKEVWALISILVYLFFLHARHAGWVGHFGTALGSVLGFTAVVWTWYGVNFVWSVGKHSYGAGAGGNAYVYIFIGLNWAFVFAAIVRYLVLANTPADDHPPGAIGPGTTGQ